MLESAHHAFAVELVHALQVVADRGVCATAAATRRAKKQSILPVW